MVSYSSDILKLIKSEKEFAATNIRRDSGTNVKLKAVPLKGE